MGLAEILQRRVKPLKFGSDNEASGTSPSPSRFLASDEDVSDKMTSPCGAEGQETSGSSGEDPEADDVREQPNNHVQNAKARKLGLRRRPVGH